MTSQYDANMHLFDFLKTGQTSITVRVRPGASETLIKGVMADGTIKIDLAAVPEDGKANAELLRFLAQDCEIPHAEIVSGHTGRKKVIRITR
jgi:uncharacterized protein (TIGR00251 family)